MVSRIIFVFISLLFLTSCTGGSPTNNPTNSGTTTAVQGTVASPTYGAGLHTVTIYADFQCPACIAFNKSVMPMFQSYAERGLLQIVYKQFPLTSIHRNAERDALAALCSVEQNKYMEYKTALYALEERKSGAQVSDAERVAIGNGILDTEKLAECVKSDKYLEQVRNEVKEGMAKGVNGTPTVFFDDKKIDNKIFGNPQAAATIFANLLQPASSASGTSVVNP